MDRSTQPASPAPELTPKRSAVPVIVGILGLLLALETVLAGYGAMQISQLQADVSAKKNEVSALEDQLAAQIENNKEIPFFYATSGYRDGQIVGTTLYEVDRETGGETELYKTTPNTFSFDLLAVPQIGYDGTIFLGFHCIECDGTKTEVKAFNVITRDEPVTVAFDSQLPNVSEAVSASKDGTKIAAVYYNPQLGETSREVVFWNLLTGEKEVVGKINEGEYFSEYVGEIFGGATGYVVNWSDSRCVDVRMYHDGELGDPTRTHKAWMGYRTFCSK